MPIEIDIRKNPTYIPDNPVTDAEFNSRNPNLIAGIASAKETLSAFVVRVASAKSEIERDPNLSSAGKAAKAKLALEVAASDVAKTQARINAIARTEQTRHAELERKLFAVPPESDPAIATRAGQIRQSFANLDKQTRVLTIRAAMETRDTETLRALLNAPKSFPLLDERTRQTVLEALAEENSPGDLSEFKNLDASLGALKEAWGSLRGYLTRTYDVQIDEKAR